MKIKVVWFENQDDCQYFDSSNQEELNIMIQAINDPTNDATSYYTESGEHIWRWPMDGNNDEDEEYEYDYSCIGIDFGPSNPWDAPGMCVSDFI